MLSEIFAVIALVIIILSVGWFMVKRDMMDESDPEDLINENFKRLSPLRKIAMLINKLSDLKLSTLCPCKSGISILRERLLKLKQTQNKAILLCRDELMQCNRAMMWLEQSDHYRDKCDPPEIVGVFKPLTDNDLEEAIKLISAPINLRQRPPVLPRCRHAATNSEDPSVPVVDKWMRNAFVILTKRLDSVRIMLKELMEYVEYDLLSDLPDVDFRQAMRNILDYLRRAVAINIKVNSEKDETKIIVDFIIPAGIPWNKAPDVVITGESWRFRNLCCTPIQFVQTQSPPALSTENINETSPSS